MDKSTLERPETDGANMSIEEARNLIFIKNYVQVYFGINIKSKCRKRPYLYARWCYYVIARQQTKSSLQSIAKIIGVDHATVLNSINTYDGQKEEDYLKDYQKCAALYPGYSRKYEHDLERKVKPRPARIIKYLQLKLHKEAEDLAKEMAGNIPFYDKYMSLNEKQKKEFETFALAKITLLNKLSVQSKEH